MEADWDRPEDTGPNSAWLIHAIQAWRRNQSCDQWGSPAPFPPRPPVGFQVLLAEGLGHMTV